MDDVLCDGVVTHDAPGYAQQARTFVIVERLQGSPVALCTGLQAAVEVEGATGEFNVCGFLVSCKGPRPTSRGLPTSVDERLPGVCSSAPYLAVQNT